jgi:starch synthase
VFQHTDNRAVESALSRALSLWSERPREFCSLMRNSMRADNSWNHPGLRYLNVYDDIRNN